MEILVVPRSLGAPGFAQTCFTEGYLYRATPGPGRLWQVQDRFSRVRYVMLDGKPCPHLVVTLPDGRQRCVGTWDVVSINLE